MRKGLFTCVVASTLLLGAEASAGQSGAVPRNELSRRAAARASGWVGLRSLSKVSRAARDDCSGLTELAYRQSDLTLLPESAAPGESAVSAIYRKAALLGSFRKEPRRGDLVFFRETYDRNRDGQRNDGLTHIGIVVDVEPDGTVTFVHRAGGGVKRSKLNVRHPEARKDARGRVLNDWLRRGERNTPGRMAGELFAGYASVDDRWRSAPRSPPRLAVRAKARRGSR